MRASQFAIALSAILATVSTVTPAYTPLMSLTTASAVGAFQEDSVPRLRKVRLVNTNFGSVPSIAVKEGTEDKTYLVSASTAFNIAASAKNLTGVAQTCIGQEIYLLTKRTDSGVHADKIWDYASWLAYTTKHKGAQVGTVKHFNARYLAIGDLTYVIDDATKFSKGGANVGRKKLEGITSLWVKGDVKDGMPVALIVSDGPGGVEAQTATNGTGNTRPESVGTNKKRPASVGNGSKSPTERDTTKKRPASVGDGRLSPTERASYVEAGYLVNVNFEFLDPSDGNQAGNPVGGVIDAAKSKVGLSDERAEIFGELKLNGSKIWEVLSKDALKVSKGYVLKLGNGGKRYTVHAERLKLSGWIKDRDIVSKDEYMGKINYDLDLYALFQKKNEHVYMLPGNKIKMIVLVGLQQTQGQP